MKLRYLLLPSMLALTGAGCLFSAPQESYPNPSPTTVSPTPSKTVTVSDQDKNTTINVNVGDQVQLVLNSTYWTIAPVSSDVLVSMGEPVVAPNLAGHIPGSGSGTVTATYTAAKAGTVQLTASRVSCGEALRCTGDQGSYAVTIVVGGSSAAAPAPAATSTNVTADTGIAIKKYTDAPTGFAMSYPAEWKLDTSSGNIELTNLGPDGYDFITIKRVMGSSVTDTDAKFGSTTVRFDDKTNQWMVTRPNENEDEIEAPAAPDFMTDTGLPVFRGSGRWATDIVALTHSKFLTVNVSGDGWTGGLDPFVKTITLTNATPKPEDITADMKAILDSEKQP